MSSPLDSAGLIEQAFVTLASTMPEIDSVLDHEPKVLPRGLPCLTMIYNGFAQADTLDEIGPGRNIAWHWTINAYVKLDDYKKAQHEMRLLCWRLATMDKIDTGLAGTAPGGWSLTDSDTATEPIFMPEDGLLLKKLAMWATTHEDHI